jgi:hypothetical protein
VTGVRKWFLAQSLPAVDKLLELAMILGVSVQWLLFGDEKFIDLGKLADAEALQVRAISQLAPVRSYQSGPEEEGAVHLALAPRRIFRQSNGYRIACDNPDALPCEQFLPAVSVGAADSLGAGLVVVGPVVAIIRQP